MVTFQLGETEKLNEKLISTKEYELRKCEHCFAGEQVGSTQYFYSSLLLM